MRIKKILKSKSIRGLNTAWYSLGNKDENTERPVLFFIHGFPDSPEVWDSQFEFFYDKYYMIAPFLRGCGPSETPKRSSRYSMDAIVLDHLEILRDIKRDIVIIAHDIGGPHAGMLAVFLGSRLKGVVLINAPTLSILKNRLKNPRQIVKSWYVGLFLIPRLGEWVLTRLGDKVLSRLRKNNPNPGNLIPHYREILRSVVQHKSFAKIMAKTLLICSKNDPYLVIPTIQEASSVSSDFQIRVLAGKHWLYEEQNSRVNPLIEKFIEALP